MADQLPLIQITSASAARAQEDRLRPVDHPQPAVMWSRDVPVSVNDTYGDPFIPEQVDNTVAKINLLQTQKTPIAIFTKAGPDEYVLERLRDVVKPESIIVFYSLTGLDEGGITYAQREEMIGRLTEIFPHVMVFARPIIQGRNDHEENLRRVVGVAKGQGLPFVLGGLHDPNKKKVLAGDVEQQLLDLCDREGVPSFYKTSCAGAWVTGLDCWVHDVGKLRNLDVAEQLGYDFRADDGVLVLRKGTTGDINFLRMLCRADVFVEEVVSNYNVLTLPLAPGILLEATSSWFAWSENIETCLDCDYCIIVQIEYLRRKRVSVGVHPSRLLEVVDRQNGEYTHKRLRGTKISRKVDRSTLHRYADMRTTKPCHTLRYEPLS
ncbi:hypothetical protein [Streptomyces sp. VNUA24]|uniref:hypothetical protein n=1 Tax=Streptomyces sp. VNUA24 TaxID=3031131 RepID=UPI0023B7DC29|nr:hypothetical protein [Streptomyces sp. VNUA24]WEH12242.1 hypothetical protein PYR72_00380 [Streptomyces sp. VNUA24]